MTSILMQLFSLIVLLYANMQRLLNRQFRKQLKVSGCAVETLAPNSDFCSNHGTGTGNL